MRLYVVIALVVIPLVVQPFSAELVYRSNQGNKRFVVLVASDVYDSLENEILRFAHDLESEPEHYGVDVYRCSLNLLPIPDHYTDTTAFNIEEATALRNFLRQLYENDSIVGAVAIGRFPYVLFEQTISGAYQKHILENYFMDLDGEWYDSLVWDNGTFVPGQNRIFDTHKGNREADIFFGRIDASNLTCGNDEFNSNEIKRLRNYFDRNHLYRLEQLISKDTALIYFDWCPEMAEGAANRLRQVYPNIKIINDSEQTNASDYLEQVQKGYQWIWQSEHATPWDFSFEYNGSYTWVGTEDIPAIPLATFFYLINGCGVGAFKVKDNILKQMIFSPNPDAKSLAGISYAGRAPPPSTFSYTGFFPALAEGKSLGEALKTHINYNYEHGVSWERLYYVLLGDPTLKPRYGNTGIEEVVLHNEPEIISQVIYNKLELKVHEPTGLEIYDALGRLVKGIALLKQGKSAVDVSDLSEGVYFVKLSKKDGKTLDKFVVVKIVKLK